VYGTDIESERSPLVAATAPLEQEEDHVLGVEPTPAESDHDRMVSAGVASGVMGLLMAGPFFGLLLGFGTAFAFDKDGTAGDAARAIGDVALVAKNKAVEVDAKHNLVKKTVGRVMSFLLDEDITADTSTRFPMVLVTEQDSEEK
jgi:hypothetical protein